MHKKQTIVIIASPGHSGQSLLCMMIGSHAKAVAVGEISKIYGKSDLEKACLLCEEKCPLWDEFSKIWTPEKNIFKQLFTFTGKEIISISKIGKFKDQINTEDFAIKVIRLIRDGRAHMASLLRKYPERPAKEIVTDWKKSSALQDKWIESFPVKDTITLRYEDFVGNKRLVMGQVCDFLEIDFQPSMLEYWKKKHHIISGNLGTLSFVKRYFNMPYKTSDDTFYKMQDPEVFLDERWKHELDQDLLFVFEAIGGRLNRKYGYKPTKNPEMSKLILSAVNGSRLLRNFLSMRKDQ